jgi:hypothetical protein
VNRLGLGPNTPEEFSPKLPVMTEFTSERASGIVVLSEVLLVVEAVDVVVVV